MRIPLALFMFSKRNQIFMLSIVVIVLLSVHLFNSGYAVYNQLPPTSSDEIDYVKSIEYFVQNGNANAFSTFDELYSPVGEYSFRGPAYSTVFGTIQHLVGYYARDFLLIFNIILSLSTLILAFYYSKNVSFGLLISAIILSSTIFHVYTTTYMVEIFQIFLSVILVGAHSFMLKHPKLGFTIPFFLALTRQSNFFYSFVGLSKGFDFNLNYLIKVVLFLILLALLALELKLIHAAYPGGKLSEVSHLISSCGLGCGTKQIFHGFMEDASLFLFSSQGNPFYMVSKYVFICSTVYCLYFGHISKNVFLFSAGTVATIFFTALLTLYDAHSWRDIRTLAGVTLFLLLVIGRQGGKRFLYLILIVQLAVYPSLVMYQQDFTSKRVLTFKQVLAGSKEKINAYRSLNELKPAANSKSDFLLISIEKGLFSTDQSVEYVSLPVRTLSGVPMRYSFERIGLKSKSKSDYMISSQECSFSEMTALQTDYFVVCDVFDTR